MHINAHATWPMIPDVVMTEIQPQINIAISDYKLSYFLFRRARRGRLRRRASRPPPGGQSEAASGGADRSDGAGLTPCGGGDSGGGMIRYDF